MENKNAITAKKFISAGLKFILALAVIAFLATESLNFFSYVLPPEQWLNAYLGLGLTGGGVIVYLLVFLWDADTPLKKTIALIILVVCALGELATAGMGAQVEIWKRAGMTMSRDDTDTMVLIIQLLGLAHATALIGYFAGDKIIELFQDVNKDGIPDILQPATNTAPMVALAADAPQPGELRKTENPTPGQ